MKKTVKLIVSIFTIITMLMIIPIISINQYYTYKVEAANIKLNYTKRTMYVGGFYWLKITGTSKKVK